MERELTLVTAPGPLEGRLGQTLRAALAKTPPASRKAARPWKTGGSSLPSPCRRMDGTGPLLSHLS